MATWRELIGKEMAQQNETWDDIEYSVLGFSGNHDAVISWDADFDEGFGMVNGCSFTIWTAKRTYFPCCYDGAEWCASVPRNPCDEATDHIGG